MTKRLKRFLKVILALVAMVVNVGAFWSWRAFAKVEDALEPIRERGEPVSIADLEPAPVADDENAATYLLPINQEIEQFVNEAYPIAYAEDFSWHTGLTDEQTARMQALLDAHPDLANQLTQASTCLRLAWPLDFDLTPTELMEQILHQEMRSIARLQVCRARYLAAIGKPDDAVAVCLQGLRLTRLQADMPCLVSWMMNIACRRELISQLNGILQTESIEPPTHEAIEQELAKQPFESHFKHALITERAFGIESFRGFPRLAATMTMSWENYIEYMNEQIDMGAPMPYQPASPPTVTPEGLTALLAPSITSARELLNRETASERCLRVLNAIESRPDPAAAVVLSDLKLPNETIIDPYSGGPLLTKATDDGWIVYSVGENGSDDGGRFKENDETADPLDIGIGPPAKKVSGTLND